MIDDAVRLMPRSLRTVLESRREQLLRGMLAPLTDEDSASHRPPWGDGTLDGTLEAEALGLVEALERPTGFDEIALRFGRLAHFVADSGFPPAMGSGDGRRYSHFAEFCKTRRERFLLVFYGHDDDLAKRGYREYARGIMERARNDDRDLARAYVKAGDPPSAAAFDDRSVPFAVGSLSYSHSVTDIVRVWLTAWGQAHGDLGYTPYRSNKQP